MTLKSKKPFCMAPFSEVEIDENGFINCCCAQYTDYYTFGNIFEQSFDEIWNGEKAKAFRQDIIDGKYTHCHTDVCSFGRLKPRKTVPSLIARYPKYVTIAYDKTCNLMCATCRDHIIRECDFSEEELKENIEKYYMPICKNASELVLNSIGECLISKHSRMLIKRLAEEYPKLEFNIMTNGTVCNEIVLKNLGLIGRLSTIQVSIHAATKETYDKITRTGNFDSVMKNLKWLSEQKKKGVIPEVLINFVVHKLNYKEIPDFVKLAEKLDITAVFWEFQKWDLDTEMLNNYDEYAVFNREHPLYNDFLDVLKNPILGSKHCSLNSLFEELRKEALGG